MVIKIIITDRAIAILPIVLDREERGVLKMRSIIDFQMGSSNFVVRHLSIILL